jgi:predicted nucleotidyltransferase
MVKTFTQELTGEKIIEFLKAHKKKLKDDFGVTKIALFGSYARGQQTKESDIDVLVELKDVDFKKRFYLKEFLERQFNKTVEIGYFKSVRPYIWEKIEKEILYVD